jgi:hypothetical protein
MVVGILTEIVWIRLDSCLSYFSNDPYSIHAVERDRDLILALAVEDLIGFCLDSYLVLTYLILT